MFNDEYAHRASSSKTMNESFKNIALELKNRGAKIININPDPSTNDIAQSETFISLKSRETFIQINNLIGHT